MDFKVITNKFEEGFQMHQQSMNGSQIKLIQFIISIIFNNSNNMQVVHQCPHYQRICHVQSPCCKIFYPCKLCHDQKFQFKKGCQVERMQFDRVARLKCLNCQQIQQPSQECCKCETKFGDYSCIKCRLYESNPKKVDDIFHCDDCKMCRRGSRQTVTHCFTCGYCVPNSNKTHKCFQNIAKSQCPVCLQQLLYSTKYYFAMRCGHLIHSSCAQQLRSLNCPTCGMAHYRMSQAQKKHIQDQIAKAKELPQELKDKKVNVMCNECLHKTTEAPFHYYGVKCAGCGSYNTKLI